MKAKLANPPLKAELAELKLSWMLGNHENELAEAARHNRTGARGQAMAYTSHASVSPEPAHHSVGCCRP